MRILFSSPLELGRTGAGRPYGKLYDYLSGEKVKEKGHKFEFISGIESVRSVYGSTPSPESLEQGTLSDFIASFDKLMRNEAPHVFLGTGCASLAQMKEILHRFGQRTSLVTTWFSSHYANASRILEQEYSKFGITAQPIDPFLIWRDKWEHKYSDRLIVPSEACRETYEADPVCKGKVSVAGFGVDSELFHPAATRPETFRVLFAGGNWIRKGLMYLVQAWNGLQLPGVLVGVGTQPPPITAWRASFQGWVLDEQIPAWYQSGSVFCLPTLEEGQALANLEAMASGLPVITTRESGAPIEDGHDGIIVPARDVQAVAAAIKRLYDHPLEAEAMGKNARAKAEALTWEKFGEAVLKVCEEAAPK